MGETLGLWISDGRAVDLILVFLVLEGALLLFHQRRTGRGLKAAAILFALLPGALLLLALRAALAGTSWVWVALALSLSLPAHLLDLKQRTRAPGP